MAAAADTKLYDILGVSKGSSDREIKKVRPYDHLTTLPEISFTASPFTPYEHAFYSPFSSMFIFFTCFPPRSGLSQIS